MSSGLRVPIRALVALALLSALVLGRFAGPAQASPSQLSIMMDDDELVYRDDATRDDALKRMQALGVDAVRVTLLWSVVADGAQDTKKATKQFKKYGAADPRAYPKANWDRYDRLVRAGKTLGIGIYFNVTGPGPSYGMTKPPAKYKADAKWWMPKPTEFAKFVKAAGKRYSGKYTDENDNKQGIPRVSFWSLWNEPNQGGWLRPQWLNGKPYSPRMYRDLYLAGYGALKATGHSTKTDVVLVGETAPRNVTRKTTTSAMGPRRFISELLCEPGTSKAGCASFSKKGPIVATGYAHHPYTRDLAPTERDPDPQAITMADLGDIGTLLDASSKVTKGLPIYSTEFGYETSPPDPTVTTTPDQQAAYLALGEFLTYSNPRVQANTQFLLRDVKPLTRYKVGSRQYWSTYQSGLFTAADEAKPAATAYVLPFLTADAGLDAAGRPLANVFGMVRQAPLLVGGATASVQLQFRPADGSADFTSFGDPITVTDPNGYFTGSYAVPGDGFVRAVYVRADGFQQPSLGQRVAPGYVAPPPPPAPTPTGPTGPTGGTGATGTTGR